MKTRLALGLAVAALLSFTGPATSSPPAQVAGEKMDSGLGQLPHYSLWADRTGAYPLGYRVAGESLDSGLGELPHFSKWVDRSGRDPMGRHANRVALASR